MQQRQLSGATRVYFIVGDPIAQVKSPAGVTDLMQARGVNAVCVPAHVKANDLSTFMQGVESMQNVDGIIVTVPHKIAFTELCDKVSDTSRFLNTVNTIRRTEQGWEADMFDGVGHVNALLKNGAELKNKRVILAGAGGAGTAIAHDLLMKGVKELAIHDPDLQRREGLVERLNSLNLGKVYSGSSDPSGYDVVINASPLGMKTGDPLPFDGDKITKDMFISDVVTAPEITAWIQHARDVGCRTSTGIDMFVCVRDLMVDFLLEKSEQA